MNPFDFSALPERGVESACLVSLRSPDDQRRHLRRLTTLTFQELTSGAGSEGIRSHASGTRSFEFLLSILNHFSGATTILLGFEPNQAPHQLNELFATM